MSTPPSSVRPADLKPMPFGRTSFRSVKNGIWEPLWGGRRVLIDVHLLPAPLRDTRGAESIAGLDSLPSAGQMGRQFLMGSGGTERREKIEAAQARRVALPSPSPTAFVAIDLLWLDGQPIIDVPLAERKRLLESVLLEGDIVRRTVAVRAPVEAWYGQWHALGFREVAVKDANSRYTPGTPGNDWATALIPRR